MYLFPNKTDADGQFTNPLKERKRESGKKRRERRGKTGQKRKEEREMDLSANEACVKFNSQ